MQNESKDFLFTSLKTLHNIVIMTEELIKKFRRLYETIDELEKAADQPDEFIAANDIEIAVRTAERVFARYRRNESGSAGTISG